jgi:hypothetical protein
VPLTRCFAAPSPVGRGIFFHFLIDPAKFRTQNVHMVSLGRLVVLILVIGIFATSLCAQACSMPQTSAPECPQHPHSGTTTCCEHSSTDATITANVDCGLGLKFASFFFLPYPQLNSFHLMNSTIVFRRYGPPDLILQHSVILPSTVLRV